MGWMRQRGSTHRPHFPHLPCSTPFPAAPAPRTGSASPSWALSPGKCGNPLPPSPSGLWPRKTPLCWEQPELEQQLFVSLRHWGSPGAALSLAGHAEEMGNTAQEGNVRRENHPSGMWELSSPSSPSIHSPGSQAGLGMLQLLPALLQTPGMHPLPESLALREVRKC